MAPNTRARKSKINNKMPSSDISSNENIGESVTAALALPSTTSSQNNISNGNHILGSLTGDVPSHVIYGQPLSLRIKTNFGPSTARNSVSMY